MYAICLLYFVTAFTDDGLQIISLTFMQLLLQFLPHILLYEIHLTANDVMQKIFLTITLFVFCTIFSMVMIYISQL